jgi:hypothetical protein
MLLTLSPVMKLSQLCIMIQQDPGELRVLCRTACPARPTRHGRGLGRFMETHAKARVHVFIVMEWWWWQWWWGCTALALHTPERK